MSGYRRFIAYVYEYQKGKKAGNCGFIKVEVKDRQCSIEVHLHCPGLPGDIPCRIYGFIRKDGLINGILLDTCETEAETVECLIETDALNMNKSDISLAKMAGMILLTDAGNFFGTEWDDQPIRPENFHELKLAVPDQRDTDSSVTASYSSTPSVVSDITTTSQELSDSADDTDSADNVDSADNISSTDNGNLSGNISSANNGNPAGNISSADNGNPTGNIVSANHTDPENFTEHIIPESSANHTFSDVSTANKNSINLADNTATPSKNTISDHSEHSGRTSFTVSEVSGLPQQKIPDTSQATDQFSDPVNSSSEKSVVPVPPAASSDFTSYGGNKKKVPRKQADTGTPPYQTQAFSPFSDGELAAAWKIHLNDLKRFPRRYNALRNNRFIQYGHYNFGHLLLGQRNDGQYILGVPGGYNQQERFMANMFGFPYFKESSYIELPKARGGYWYNLIDAPDSHK